MTFMQAKHVQKGSQDGLIKDVQKQGKKSASPRLFSLSALQTMINRRYHASAADVLKAVQALYEANTYLIHEQIVNTLPIKNLRICART